MQATHGKWMSRFIWAAIIQGLCASIWTVFLIFPGVTPAPSMILAEGSAGLWLLLGYCLYLIVGVIGVAVTALFYFYLENIVGKVYTGATNVLAWLHYVLMNVGVAGATWLLMYGGYKGGAGLLATSEGGGGLTPLQVHVQILQYFVTPIGYLVAITACGILLGGIGYIIRSRTK